MIISYQEEAEELFNPLYGKLVGIVKAAINDWGKTEAARSLENTSVRANYIWNQNVNRMRRDFSDVDGVRFVTLNNNLKGLLVGEKFFIRPKFGDKFFKSRNYQTRSVIMMSDPNENLFGDIIPLELVYKLNDLGLLDQIAIVRKNGPNDNLWEIILPNDADMESDVALSQIISLEKQTKQASLFERMTNRNREHEGIDIEEATS